MESVNLQSQLLKHFSSAGDNQAEKRLGKIIITIYKQLLPVNSFDQFV